MHAQVTVLSEGHQLYFGPPDQAAAWFAGSLGYEHLPARDGAVSDWLMDMVSVGFVKPAEFAARCVAPLTPDAATTLLRDP